MRRLLPLAIALLVLAPSFAAAQSAVRLSSGAIAPVAPQELSDATKAGVDLSVGVQLPLTARFSLVAAVSHDRFEAWSDRVDGAGAMTAWSGTLDLRVNLLLSARVQPYVVAGGGAYVLDDVPALRPVICLASGPRRALFGSCPESVADTRDPGLQPGIQVGGGVSVGVTRALRVFVEPTYTQIFTTEDNVRYVPIRAGVTLRR